MVRKNRNYHGGFGEKPVLSSEVEDEDVINGVKDDGDKYHGVKDEVKDIEDESNILGNKEFSL